LPKQAELILLEVNIEERLKITMDAYGINMHNDFIMHDSIKGFDNFAQYWLRSLEKIQKR
jgi:tRNA 2-selenouridine synthase